MTSNNNLTTRLIRKYRNRKFYDKQTHSYITLQDIYGYFSSGDTIQIVDADDHDITENTLLDAVITARQSDPGFREAVFKLGRA